MTKPIGMGLIGSGYMGKAHAVAMQAVGASFNTELRPICEMIATSNPESAARAAKALGFARHTGDWREVVSDPAVEAVVIASPQDTHYDIAMTCFEQGKHVFCEKPLALSLEDAEAMATAAKSAGVIHMIGFNYVRTPATQYARQLVAAGEIGDVIYVRAEHAEDFSADGTAPFEWRYEGLANGNLGDLAPHPINMMLALGGDIESLVAHYQTVHSVRSGKPVTNDDHAHFLCRFAGGAMGYLMSTRVAHGRKMGYCYEVQGTLGTLRFDQEDQNALWLYKHGDAPEQQGFKKILTNPAHPDYVAFNLGPGHGTGYQDQIIIEQKDFLTAIAMGENRYPTFEDGLVVHQVVDAIYRSQASGGWESV
ncbi:MAG: Gfo/Idh/MocA family oxidoreductase [Gammaproteobacteria bacterium]|nr:Gfo/Idh/MocA family oxidoreductase [Gammaproteobacteria bacterium]